MSDTTVPPVSTHCVGEVKVSDCTTSKVWHVTGHERTTLVPPKAMLRLGAGSLTVTVNAHWLLLPLVLLAVQVTTVAPAGKLDPLVGLQVMVVSGQLSTNEVAKFTI